MTIYLPPPLYRAVKALKLPASRICRQALSEQVSAAAGEADKPPAAAGPEGGRNAEAAHD